MTHETPPAKGDSARPAAPNADAADLGDSRSPTVLRDELTETDFDVDSAALRKAGATSTEREALRNTAIESQDSEPTLPRKPIGGRYRALLRLGQGAGGTVFEAVDELNGERVAVKLLWAGVGHGGRRVGREIAALRALDLPGVAKLLDEGLEGAQRFIVMSLVEGHPFPGDLPRPSWESVARPTLALLATLHQVHEVGIIHRDLKPSNVLVDEDGRPIILDFGLARGSRLGQTFTRTGAILGTPRYQSPEQMDGRPVDARADVYAVGVMVYEALAGQPPHDAGSVEALRFKRLTVDPTPLAQVVPEVPAGVAAVIEWMLSREPAQRPQTAAEALTALQAESDLERDEPLPWLGSRGPIEALVAAARARRPFDLTGPSGTGKSRVLREAVAELAAGGSAVAELVPGERPFESLAPLFDLGTLASPDPDTLLHNVDQALGSRLAAGLIVIADEGEGRKLDRWTSEALARARKGSAVIRVVPEDRPADCMLAPLSQEQLWALFAGPDRLLHLREDGAHQLHARTQGVPQRIVREVNAWIGGGLARWEGELLALNRESLRRLSARPRLSAGTAEEWLTSLSGPLAELMAWITLSWPHASPTRLQAATLRPDWEIGVELAELTRLGAVERRPDGSYEPRGPALDLPSWPWEQRQRAHIRLAELIPEGAPGRLEHLIAAGGPREIADEAIRASRREFEAGQLDAAIGLLSEALPAVRDLLAEADEARILVELARLALTDQVPASVRRAHYELERRAHIDVLVWRIDELLKAALELGEPGGGNALELAEAIDPFDDPLLELVRHQVRGSCALVRPDPEEAVRVFDSMADWFASQSEAVQGYYDGWIGLLRYRQTDFEQAIEQHRRAAERRPDVGGRLSSLVNVAVAMLDSFRLDEARAVAQSVQAEARRLRLPLYEGYAELIGRFVAYRQDEVDGPDHELFEAATVLEHRSLAASIGLCEAAVAWRAGDRQAAAHLAARARALFGQSRRLQADLLRALELAATGQADEKEVGRLVHRASTASLPRVGAQIIGLLRRLSPEEPPEWREAIRKLARSTPSSQWSQRLEVLSLEESLSDPVRR